MINLKFAIANPFSDRFEILYCKDKKLTEYKAIEASVYQSNAIITLSLGYTVRQDHAGLRIVVGLFGYECQLNIYDTRHWDYEKQQWESYK